MKPPIQQDVLWKAAIEDFFDAFLAYFYPEYLEMIDFNRPFEFLNQELDQIYPKRKEKSRRADKLVKVWLKDGNEQWFLVHVEVQGYDDATFARRMFTSFYRILDKHNRAITATVIYTHAAAQHLPTAFSLNWMKTSLEYKFNTFVLPAMTLESLDKQGNPFGLVLQAAWAVSQKDIHDSQWLLELKLAIARKMLRAGMSRERFSRLMHFLDLYVHLPDSEDQRIFDHQVHHLSTPHSMGIIEVIQEHYIEQGRQEGRQEGREEGRLEGWQEAEMAKDRAYVTRLVHAGYDDASIESITGCTLAFIRKMRAELAQ